ncbi:MAG: MarR family transcriptional regulator [Legionellales bacterium]|nr:MarR family transcriptional regulator [Legionellales bacterium]
MAKENELMRIRDYFPLGMAIGDAFCNRKKETEILVENILNGKHSLLIASRRYGKSSLALHALSISHLPYTEIDFYMASSEKIIETYILHGVADLMGKALGAMDKWINSIKKYVKNLNPKLEIGGTYMKLELTASTQSDPAMNVKEALLLLERLLEEKKTSAVLLMDEFQNVGMIAKGKGIEGAIRHVAQKTRYLTILFSGSNRHLLRTMFEDEARPLYKLCWQLPLKRIALEHYQIHLQKAAQIAWSQHLSDEVFYKIMQLTERHPYYVNKFCDKLWTYCSKKPPCMDDVNLYWLEVLEEEKSDAIKEISILPAGQKNVLLKIAQKNTLKLTSKQTILELQMPSSSIMRALASLEEKDLIEKEGNEYQIINPIISFYVLKNAPMVS